VRKHKDTLVVTIGILKLVKAVTLVLLAVGALSMLHKDVVHVITQWVHPASETGQRAVHQLDGVDDHKLEVFGIGGILYAALFAIEGIGLISRKVWGEYLTVIITTSFIPLEIYELVSHRSAVKGIVIVLNIAVVVYLVLRLRSDHRWPFKQRRHALARAT
jgi:uncharacterized membrane protein (DUF2068 family)